MSRNRRKLVMEYSYHAVTTCRHFDQVSLQNQEYSEVAKFREIIYKII